MCNIKSLCLTNTLPERWSKPPSEGWSSLGMSRGIPGYLVMESSTMFRPDDNKWQDEWAGLKCEQSSCFAKVQVGVKPSVLLATAAVVESDVKTHTQRESLARTFDHGARLKSLSGGKKRIQTKAKPLRRSKIVPKHFFPSHTNSIINPISSLPMPNVMLRLSYSWLRAESVGFGRKNVNRGMLGYGWPSCVSASRLIKRLCTPYMWPKARSSRVETVQ